MSHSGKLYQDFYPINIAGMPVNLPLINLTPDRAISLLITIDMGVSFMERAGAKLAEQLRPLKPEVIVSSATLGIPVAIETSRALGLDRYVILQKSPKIHLGDALVQTVQSITSKGEQRLLLDRRHLPLIAGRRVVVVDDVIASGATLKAAINLARMAGAEVVGAGAILTETYGWEPELGPDAALVHAIGHIPQFTRTADGWVPIPETEKRP